MRVYPPLTLYTLSLPEHVEHLNILGSPNSKTIYALKNRNLFNILKHIYIYE